MKQVPGRDIDVCVLRVALKYKKRLWEFFQRLGIDEPATQSMANYGLFIDIGVHIYTWGHNMPTQQNELALPNYWKKWDDPVTMAQEIYVPSSCQWNLALGTKPDNIQWVLSSKGLSQTSPCYIS